MLRLFSFLLVGISAFVIGCQNDPYTGDLSTTKPKRNDIPGVYKLVKQTLNESGIDSVPKVGLVVLNSDGTYLADSLPNYIEGEGSKPFVSSRGLWELTTVNGVDNGWGHPKDNWVILLKNIDDNFSRIYLSRDKPPYDLLFNFDDFDFGKLMIFKKKIR